jgi:hypothetical protein
MLFYHSDTYIFAFDLEKMSYSGYKNLVEY